MNDVTKLWNGRRYFSLDSYLKSAFGEKLYKLSLNGGMSSLTVTEKYPSAAVSFAAAAVPAILHMTAQQTPTSR